MNQTKVDKKTKINPEEENTGRRADLHLPESQSDCSEECFTLPHLPAEATAVDSHPIIHLDIAERCEMFPVSTTLHNSAPLLRRETLLKHVLLPPLSHPMLSSLPSVCL